MNRKELFNKSAETQARQRMVNTKTYGLVATIALAGAFTVVGTGTVSADENTAATPVVTETVAATDNLATNLVEAQPATPVENTNLQAQANTNTGDIVTSIETPALDLAVQEAEASGVIVTEGETVIHDSLEAAHQDAATQEVAVKTAESEKVANNEAIAEAKATNAQIDADNAAEEKRVEEANKAGQAATDQRNKLGQAAVDERNANAMAEWEANKETIIAADEAAMAGYESRKKANEEANAKGQAEADAKNAELKAEYTKALAEYNALLADNAEIQKRNDAAAAAAKAENERLLAEYQAKVAETQKKLNTEGYATEVIIKSLTFESEPNASVALSGNYQYATEKWAGVKPVVQSQLNSMVERIIQSATTTPTDTSDVWNQSDAVPVKAVILKNQGDTVKAVYSNLVNSSYNGTKITEAEYIVTSKTAVPQLIMLANDPTQGLIAYNYGKVQNACNIQIKFKDALGNYIQASSERPFYLALSSLNSHVLSNGNAVRENGEHVPLEAIQNYNFEFIGINGSTITENADGIYSKTNNVSKTAGSKYSNAEWDQSDNPLFYYGSGIGKLTSGNAISFDFVNMQTTNADWSNGQWLTISTKVAAATLTPPPSLKEVKPEELKPVPSNPPTLETVDYNPTPFNEEPPTPSKIPNQPILETFTPEVYTPITPVVKPHVDIPKVETIKATVHPIAVKDTPAITKDVVNSEGTSVDGELVAKNSTETWVLNPGILKAGREAMATVVLTDPFPVGTKIFRDETAKLSPEWVISYDKTGGARVTLSANELAKVNADLSKDVVLPTFKVVFTVLNDGATYKNTYTMTLTTESGKTYRTTSNTPVIYTPGSETRTYNGNVIVRYFTDESGTAVKIAPNQTDLEDAKVGTKYDTTDHKDATIAFDGQTYKLTGKVVGNETGTVTDGTLFVDYFYELVPVEEGKGNVIVHYVDEEGHKISGDVVDVNQVPVGKEYTTTDNKPVTITTEDNIQYDIQVDKTVGKEDGTVTEGTTEVTYVYKRVTPKPETPTPNDSLIEPEKHIYQVGETNGAKLDGLQLLPNKTYSYTAVTDNNQYKGVKATQEAIQKGFIPLVDDHQDNTVTFDFSTLKTALADGTDVSSDFEVRSYESLEKADAEVVAILKAARITPDGNFSVVVPKGLDFDSYYIKYVTTGTNLYHTFEVKTGDYVGDFSNKVWQVEFGNGYAGNTVENNIPKLDGIKKILESIGSNKDLTGGIIELGQTYPAKLSFPVVKTTIDGGLKSLYGIENFDENFDEYNGEFYAFASGTMKLKDGTTINAEQELTRYVVQELIRDEKTGKVVAVKYSVNPEFYDLLAEGEEVKIDAYAMLKRIAYGENIENGWTVYVNDVEVDKDVVKTSTPKPIPEQPTTGTPVAPAQVLPSTGETDSMAMAALGASLAIAGLGLARRKRNS